MKKQFGAWVGVEKDSIKLSYAVRIFINSKPAGKPVELPDIDTVNAFASGVYEAHGAYRAVNCLPNS